MLFIVCINIKCHGNKKLTARWRTETYGEVESSLEKGYLKERLHLTYLDMSILLTWFILFLRKIQVSPKEKNKSFEHEKYEYSQRINILFNFYNWGTNSTLSFLAATTKRKSWLIIKVFTSLRHGHINWFWWPRPFLISRFQRNSFF